VIYSIQNGGNFLDAPFYAPRKLMGGEHIDTFVANMIIIWAMTLLLCLTLYTDIFKVTRFFIEGLRHKRNR
jgi:hypothetical protein